MAQIRPTEVSVVNAAANVIRGTQINGAPLSTKVVPRWILALEIGQAVSLLARVNPDNAADMLPINSWVLTSASWEVSKVKSQSGVGATPRDFIPGFDDLPGTFPDAGDLALNRDYKIKVTGSLKIWQLVEYRQGSDLNNSEIDSMVQRQAVIDSFSAAPRFGLEWFDFEHDELKVPAIAILPFDSSLLHIAQCNIPFSFTYVATAA